MSDIVAWFGRTVQKQTNANPAHGRSLLLAGYRAAGIKLQFFPDNNNLHIAFGLRGAIADEMLKQKIQMGSDEYSTVGALQSSTIPVMLIHDTDDHFVPVEMTYGNYKACAGPKRLLIVPGADHGMSYFVEKDRYEEEIKRFWRDFD